MGDVLVKPVCPDISVYVCKNCIPGGVHLPRQWEQDGLRYHEYSYSGAQGNFELQIPAERCYIIESDSTIENLAQHVADVLREEQPGHSYEVRAFEGIGKGAVGRA